MAFELVLATSYRCKAGSYLALGSLAYADKDQTGQLNGGQMVCLRRFFADPTQR